MRVEWLSHLPPEVWVMVFSYLSTQEKHRVRCCCKVLKKLIDHPCLWRNHMVVLSNFPRYTVGFWDTLKYRRVTRVVVQRLRPKDWKHLVKSLPWLTTIVCMEGQQNYKKKNVDNLPDFPNLKTLGIRNATWSEPMLQQCQTGHLAERLTHLSVCNIQLPSTAEFVNSVSRLFNLEYLLFHQQAEGKLQVVEPVPSKAFHNLLLNLKKLKHLSWEIEEKPEVPLPDDYFYPPDPEDPEAYGGPTLTSLELVNYPETMLSENALRGLTSLKSLTVHYRYLKIGVKCRLQSWLSHLQELESLEIIGGNSLALYTTTFPPRVTRLALRVIISLKDLCFIAKKVKKLEHLDMHQNRFSGSLCKKLPSLFPQLKTLRIRYFHEEPKRDLLLLRNLKHLEQLELIVERSYILKSERNDHPWPSPSLQELIRELQELSENRINIITTMRQRNLFRECDCVWEGE
ncbi:collectin sub-family member 10 [Sarotherodon galilaeus]